MSDQTTRQHRPQSAESHSAGTWRGGDAHDASLTPDDYSTNWTIDYLTDPSPSDEGHGLTLDIEYSSSFDDSSNALGLDIPAPGGIGPYLDTGAQYYSHNSTYTQLPHRQAPSLMISTDVAHSPYRNTSYSGLHSPYHSAAPSSSSPSIAGHDSMPRTPASLPLLPRPLYVNPSDAYAYTPSHSYSPTKAHSPYLSPAPSVGLSSPMPSAFMGAISPLPAPPQAPLTTVLEVAARFPGYDNIVPQKVYRPNTQSDRRRYVEEVHLEAPIMFLMQQPDGLGISCKDAMTSRFSRLVGRDDAMFENRGPSVSIRLNWPGYPPWSRQIPTRDFRSPPGPITRSKLAKNVAKTVLRFLDEKRGKQPEDDEGQRWRLANITIDQLELIGLQHVSMGSWQAHLRLRQRT